MKKIEIYTKAEIQAFIRDEVRRAEERIVTKMGLIKRVGNVGRWLVKLGLKDREAMVIEKRLGLNGNKPMTFREIGEAMLLSPSRINGIFKMGTRKLRHPTRIRQIQAKLAPKSESEITAVKNALNLSDKDFEELFPKTPRPQPDGQAPDRS